MASDELIGIDTADMYDPEVLDAAEAQQRAERDINDGEVLAELNRRRKAYANVFTAGTREQADVDIVLNDLMYFCKVWVDTFNIADGLHAETLSHRKAGRREVFLRIKDFTRLDSDVLLLKYSDAIKQGV